MSELNKTGLEEIRIPLHNLILDYVLFFVAIRNICRHRYRPPESLSHSYCLQLPNMTKDRYYVCAIKTRSSAIAVIADRTACKSTIG